MRDHFIEQRKLSERGARHLADFTCGIQPAKSHLHVTCTFCDPALQGDIVAAEKRFKSFLDWATKSFSDSGILWFQEFKKKHGFHFHVLILTWNCPNPLEFQKTVTEKVWNHWNFLNEGRLSRDANWITAPKIKNREGLLYFTAPPKRMRKIVITKEPTGIGERFWSFRNSQVIKENSIACSKSERREWKKFLFPERRVYRRKNQASCPTPEVLNSEISLAA